METLKLISANSEHALGEVRTDKRLVDWVVDNTDGKLTAKIKTYQQLLSYVKSATYLKLEPSRDATPNLLRYVLDNGDVVEITTDQKTVILNNELLDEPSKRALMQAIVNKDLQVSVKADPSKPVQVMPKIQTIAPESRPKGSMTEDMEKAVNMLQSQSTEARKQNSKNYDYDIETGDYRGAEDPQYAKQMLYNLKYGAGNE